MVPSPKFDASIWLTRENPGRSFGVTFVQILPPSFVTWTSPSSEPVQMTLTFFLPGPTEKITPYTSGPFMSPVIGPPECPCVTGSCRVRSPLIAVQFCPPLVVFHRRCDDAKRSFGSAFEK